MSADAFPLRCDSYQTVKACAAIVFTRGHKVEDLAIHSEEKSLKIDLTVDGNRVSKVWTWYGEVVADSAKAQQGVKIEITLQKKAPGQWPQVEAVPEAAPAEPAYAKWGKMKLPEEEEEKNEGFDHFLQKIYHDQDEDGKRAMLKSMYESQGTVLNCNWGEVGKKHVDPYKSDEEKEKEKQEKK